MSSRCQLLVLAAALIPGLSPAAEQPPGSPLFSRHVVPLLSRLGCNAGTCHGAVKGQGGLRLTLFGADPALDYQRLTREFGGRRLDSLDPPASLLLRKATGKDSHGGGARMAATSPEYAMLQAWIAKGAPSDPVANSQLKQLHVKPSLQTLKPGESGALAVEAVFADGSVEDVTGLCTFDVLEKDVATVDARGRVEARGAGDTALMVRYRSEPALAHLVVPGPASEPFPDSASTNVIDRHILAKLHQLNVPPSDLCDDAAFLRRASLHVTGLPPTPDEVRKFLADKAPDKRTTKVDELLARPGYAALWATKFSDILRTNFLGENENALLERRCYEWLRQRMMENTPYDELAERILLASTREGRSAAEYLAEIQALAEEERAKAAEIKLYSQRRTLDLYWLRRDSKGVKGALQVAHAFLGLRLECAQCHRHPHDVWQQHDLLEFANFFTQVGTARREGSADALKKKVAEGKLPSAEAEVLQSLAQLLEEGKALDAEAKELLAKAKGLPKVEADKVTDAVRARSSIVTTAVKRIMGSEVAPLALPKTFTSVSSPLGTQKSDKCRLLGAAAPVVVPMGQDPRELVMEWLRRPDNPYFARAIVNRVWATYFGRGIVDPPDHLSPLNPPSHPELLNDLCEGFIRSKYDLKWLHRTILTSQTYQRSSTLKPANRADTRNYASFYPQRLPVEVLVDALNQATGTAETYAPKLFIAPGSRALEVPGSVNVAGSNDTSSVKFPFEIFGRPTRSTEMQCDCDRNNSTTMVQALYLLNHPRVLEKIASPNGRVAEVVKQVADDDQRVEEIFLWTLGRPPTQEQRKTCVDYVTRSPSPQKGLEDVLWSLLNTNKFLLNH